MIASRDSFYSSLPAGFDGEFDWEFLQGCFPRGIMPMDIDACVETSGHFLAFETKDPGKEIPRGQRRTLEALVRTSPFTVFVLQGKRAPFRKFEAWYKDCKTGLFTIKQYDPDVEVIRQKASGWFNKYDDR